MRQEEWSVRLVRVIAQEVRRHRSAQKMSAQQLADRCTELGLPIKRSVIANLETGHRETVTVPELLVLGAALNVSPALLASPVGHSESVEILPELDVDPWSAVRWIALAGQIGEFTDTTGVVPLYSQHDALILKIREGAVLADDLLKSSGDSEATESDRQLRRSTGGAAWMRVATWMQELEQHRGRMRQMDLLPPSLPSDVEALAALTKDTPTTLDHRWEQ